MAGERGSKRNKRKKEEGSSSQSQQIAQWWPTPGFPPTFHGYVPPPWYAFGPTMPFPPGYPPQSIQPPGLPYLSSSTPESEREALTDSEQEHKESPPDLTPKLEGPSDGDRKRKLPSLDKPASPSKSAPKDKQTASPLKPAPKEEGQLVSSSLQSTVSTGEAQVHELLGYNPHSRMICTHPHGGFQSIPGDINETTGLWRWLRRMNLEEVRVADGVWWKVSSEPESRPLPEVFTLHVRSYNSGASQELALQQLVDLGRYSQAFTDVPRSSYVSIPSEACPELYLWETRIVKRGVPRTIVDIDELLEPLRPLVAELRYLHFLLFESKEAELEKVLKMRRGRLKGQNDLEPPYHPLLLQFCLGAASGQPEIEFLKEAHFGSAREDIGCRAAGTSQPSEVKATFHCAVQNDPTGGIDRNKEPFAKMLKCNEKDPQRWHLGLFGERIERLWFALFTYGEDNQVESLKVAPEFPLSKVWNRKNLLFDISKLDNPERGATLQDVVPVQPSPGFKLLVRFVDTLCVKLAVPQAPIQLVRDDDGVTLDLTGATVIGEGAKSVVLRFGVESYVIKVSQNRRITRECDIHVVVDGLAFIRPMYALHWCGTVTGAGDGLRWMALSGFGRAVRRSDLLVSFERLWDNAEKAVYGLHGRMVYHRDIKPGNFFIFNGELQLNDFDASCFVDDPFEVRQQHVGTPFFDSPFFEEEVGFLYRDDWCSLALSFLFLLGVYAAGDKKTVLMRALNMEWVPKNMKECIRWIFSAEAANGMQREMTDVMIKMEAD